MKSIKTIALALALSTGACTMHAGGEPVANQNKVGQLLVHMCKAGIAAGLSYKTVTFYSSDNIIDMFDKLGSFFKTANHETDAMSAAITDFNKGLERALLYPRVYSAVQCVAGGFLYDIYKSALERIVG